MPRPTDRNSNTPLHKKKTDLELKAEKLKAEISQTRQFLQKAPEMKNAAQKREQQEIINTYRRPVHLQGPVDFRYDLVKSKPSKHVTLRSERSKAPLLTFALLITLGVVAYYTWRNLFHA